jgi:hypothetical protein
LLLLPASVLHVVACGQAHALADLWARLELHNQLTALELAALRDWVSARFQATGNEWQGTPPLPSRTQLWQRTSLLQQVQVQLVQGPLLQQQVVPYSGPAQPAGEWGLADPPGEDQAAA